MDQNFANQIACQLHGIYRKLRSAETPQPDRLRSESFELEIHSLMLNVRLITLSLAQIGNIGSRTYRSGFPTNQDFGPLSSL